MSLNHRQSELLILSNQLRHMALHGETHKSDRQHEHEHEEGNLDTSKPNKREILVQVANRIRDASIKKGEKMAWHHALAQAAAEVKQSEAPTYSTIAAVEDELGARSSFHRRRVLSPGYDKDEDDQQQQDRDAEEKEEEEEEGEDEEDEEDRAERREQEAIVKIANNLRDDARENGEKLSWAEAIKNAMAAVHAQQQVIPSASSSNNKREELTKVANDLRDKAKANGEVLRWPEALKSAALVIKGVATAASSDDEGEVDSKAVSEKQEMIINVANRLRDDARDNGENLSWQEAVQNATEIVEAQLSSANSFSGSRIRAGSHTRKAGSKKKVSESKKKRKTASGSKKKKKAKSGSKKKAGSSKSK